MNGKYGGTTTTMKELPVGTLFYVCNGNWEGSIVEKDGVKCIAIGGINGKLIPLIDHTLDIEIKDLKGLKQQKKLLKEFKELKRDIQYLSSIVQYGEDFVTENDLVEFNEDVNTVINTINSLKMDVLDFYNKR